MLDTVMGVLCMMLGVAGVSLEVNRLLHCSARAEAKIIEVRRQRDARGVVTYNPIFEFCVDGMKTTCYNPIPTDSRYFFN